MAGQNVPPYSIVARVLVEHQRTVVICERASESS